MAIGGLYVYVHGFMSVKVCVFSVWAEAYVVVTQSLHSENKHIFEK